MACACSAYLGDCAETPFHMRKTLERHVCRSAANARSCSTCGQCMQAAFGAASGGVAPALALVSWSGNVPLVMLHMLRAAAFPAQRAGTRYTLAGGTGAPVDSCVAAHAGMLGEWNSLQCRSSTAAEPCLHPASQASHCQAPAARFVRHAQMVGRHACSLVPCFTRPVPYRCAHADRSRTWVPRLVWCSTQAPPCQ
jgi:hypothetical protein